MEISFDFSFDDAREVYFAFCYPWGYVKNQVNFVVIVYRNF